MDSDMISWLKDGAKAETKRLLGLYNQQYERN